MANENGKFILYHYNPSTVAAVVFVALFSVSTFGHLIQLATRKTWYFIPFVIGGGFEIAGYGGRLWSSRQSPDWTVPPYVMQSLLLLLAPALFAASIYMVLGRIIRLTDGEAYSLIRASRLTKIFVAGDVLSFLVQSTGGGVLAQSDGDKNKRKLGERLIVVGLVLQILFFGFFMIVSATFHYRISLYPTTRCQTLIVPWKRTLHTLYFASVLIMIRSAFRVVEYVQGTDGFLMKKELFLYIFDASLMFLTMVVFNIFHPSQVLANGHKPHAAGPSQGSYEMTVALDRGGYDHSKP